MIKHLRNVKVFLDYSQTNDDVYENLEDKPIKEREILVVLDDMIADV